MKHEKGVLETVTKLELQSFQPKARIKQLRQKYDAGALKVCSVAEDYPKPASQNFLQLQEELSGTESKIAFARQLTMTRSSNTTKQFRLSHQISWQE